MDREHYKQDLEQIECSMHKPQESGRTGRDLVESIHPAPSSDLRKEGRNTYIHTDLYSAKNCENESEALKKAPKK